MIQITQVRLKNWFNYAGEYDENTIEFKAGINFFCADNNAGKSKLHNALRWVLSNKLILDRKEVQLTGDAFLRVVNDKYFHKLNAGEEFNFGVQIDYVKTNSRYENKYRLCKEVKGIKDGEWNVSEQLMTPGRGTSWVRNSAVDAYRERNQFIPEKFQRYLFLEGEQLNSLIPFSGPKLNATINDVTNIATIEKRLDRSKSVAKALEKQRDAKIAQLNRGSAELSNAIERKQSLETKLTWAQGELAESRKTLEILTEKKQKLQDASEAQQAIQQSIIQIEKFETNATGIENRIEYLESTFYTLISKKFKISKYCHNEEGGQYLNNEYRDIIRNLKAERRSKLDNQLDEEKQRMVARLIKNQPGIEILEEIAEEGKCFICGTSPLSADSIDYIQKDLIPHFSGDNDINDDNLKLLESVNQIINGALKGLETFRPDDNSFNEVLEQIAEAQETYDAILNNKREYIQNHGDHREAESGRSIIHEYDQLIAEIHDKQSEISGFERDIGNLNSEIKSQDLKIRANSGIDNKETLELEKAMEFQTKLSEKIASIKENIYAAFCDNLEEWSTKRLHKYFGNNPRVIENSFKVSRNKDSTGKFNFAINVCDRNGNVVSEPGGAETKIRQYCVVLSLVELANKTQAQIGNFPFIVDAPISQLNTDYRLQFYKTLLSEKVNSQTIILTYDLVTAAPDSKINEDGETLFGLMSGSAADNSGVMLFKKDRDTPVIVFNGQNQQP